MTEASVLCYWMMLWIVQRIGIFLKANKDEKKQSASFCVFAVVLCIFMDGKGIEIKYLIK